jgi:hypothetical protein
MNGWLKKCALAILWGCVSTMTLVIVPSKDIRAASRPFLIQQFTNTPGSWFPAKPDIVPKSEIGSYKANCTRSYLDQYIPDIIGEAYSSDGETLRDTIWLQDPFTDPSVNHDTIITIQRVNLTKINQYNPLSSSHVSLIDGKLVPYKVSNGITSKTTSGYATTTYNYTSKGGSMMIVEKKYPIFYIITFDTHPDQFNSYWQSIKNSLYLFDFLPFDTLKGRSHVTSVHPFAIPGVKIPIPAGWRYVERHQGNPNVDVFAPDPRWIHVSYFMMIEVVGFPGYGSAHSDYAVYTQWDRATNHWTQDLYQLSLRQPTLPSEKKVLQSTPIPANFTNTPINRGSHIDIPLKLSYIGYPTSYLVNSGLVLTFSVAGVSPGCIVEETTMWIPLPPPKINFYTIPNSLTLRPGDETNIQVHANSSTPSVVLLNASSNELKTEFYPKSIDLSSSPVGTSTLHIKASPDIIKNAKGTTEFPLPIKGNVSFPIGTIDTSTGFYVHHTPVGLEHVVAYPEITIKNAPNLWEEIVSWFQFIQPNLTLIQALVAAVVVIITPITTLVIWWTKKKRA